MGIIHCERCGDEIRAGVPCPCRYRIARTSSRAIMCRSCADLRADLEKCIEILSLALSQKEDHTNCAKIAHTETQGYLHAEDDDGPYNVDGCLYCGRCHRAL